MAAAVTAALGCLVRAASLLVCVKSCSSAAAAQAYGDSMFLFLFMTEVKNLVYIVSWVVTCRHWVVTLVVSDDI